MGQIMVRERCWSAVSIGQRSCCEGLREMLFGRSKGSNAAVQCLQSHIVSSLFSLGSCWLGVLNKNWRYHCNEFFWRTYLPLNRETNSVRDNPLSPKPISQNFLAKSLLNMSGINRRLSRSHRSLFDC